MIFFQISYIHRLEVDINNDNLILRHFDPNILQFLGNFEILNASNLLKRLLLLFTLFCLKFSCEVFRVNKVLQKIVCHGLHSNFCIEISRNLLVVNNFVQILV